MVKIPENCYNCRYFLASEVAEFMVWRWLERELEGMAQLKYGRIHAEYLADAMFDYLAIASLGEARHSHLACYNAYVNLPKGVHRVEVYREAHLFEPMQFLPVLSELFNRRKWKEQFGGKSWGKAVDMALKYLKGELSPVLFVDGAIWLHHNTGVIFNKPLIFIDGGRYVFRKVLDAGRYARTPLEFVKNFYMSSRVRLFLKEVFDIECRPNYRSMLDKGYRKVSWRGEKELVLYERKEEQSSEKKEKVRAKA